MRSIRWLALTMTMVISIGCLNACSTPSPNVTGTPAQGRTVEYFEPLSTPIYEKNPSYTKFEDVHPLGKYNKYHDYIFKGKINKITEVEISWITDLNHQQSTWLSVWDVTIENVLFGNCPGVKDTIKVVSPQSTRCSLRIQFNLSVGKEYYFMTHIFDDSDITRSDPVDEYLLGDVYCANTRHALFPIDHGKVLFQDWPFKDAELPVVTEESVTATIDEDAFLEQFTQMIKEAKAMLTQAAGTTGDVTAIPSETASTVP